MEFEIEELIDAAIETVFDLAHSIDLHVESTAQTSEKAVGGCTTGLIGLGETVTFEARHFGWRFQMTSKIVEFDRPGRFVDQMVEGPFRSFRHVHEFSRKGEATLMRDRIVFYSPLGPLGRLVDRLIMARHMKKLLQRRALILKRVAESERARDFL